MKKQRARKAREWWALLYPDGKIFTSRLTRKEAVDLENMFMDDYEIVCVREILPTKKRRVKP